MQKMTKIAKVVHDLCKSLTEHLGNFVEAFAKIDKEEPDFVPPIQPAREASSSRRVGHRIRGV